MRQHLDLQSCQPYLNCVIVMATTLGLKMWMQHNVNVMATAPSVIVMSTVFIPRHMKVGHLCV